jgi:SM-20-related protein
MLGEAKLEKILSGLTHEGWVVVEDFLPSEICLDLVKVIKDRYAAGSFRKAGIGKGDNFRLDARVRSDAVYWLDREAPGLGSSEIHILDVIENIRISLNQALYLGLEDFEGHLTVYPEGGHYARHVDRFTANTGRTISFVLYLNQDRIESDGGILRILDPKSQDRVVAEVVPQAGTLVLFMSEDVPHEVTRSHKERMSVTGWYLRGAGSLFR